MTDTEPLQGLTVAFLATEGVERVELTDPWQAVTEAGAEARLVSTDDEVRAFDHLDAAETFPTDDRVADASPDRYDALVLPGGVANPDALRMDDDAVAFVRGFFDAGKPVAAICHAPWTLIEAGAASGRRLTSWPSLQTDLRNAGAEWVDEPLVHDDGAQAVAADGTAAGSASLLLTSRNPDDLPVFCQALVGALTDLAAARQGGGAP